MRERSDARTEEDRLVDLERAEDEGLSGAEAAVRLERYGPNALTEERQSLLLEIGSHFWGPIPWMIQAALVLRAQTARWADFVIIAALLLLNGVVGFWEEHQAKSAIDALRDRLAQRARLRRRFWRAS